MPPEQEVAGSSPARRINSSFFNNLGWHGLRARLEELLLPEQKVSSSGTEGASRKQLHAHR